MSFSPEGTRTAGDPEELLHVMNISLGADVSYVLRTGTVDPGLTDPIQQGRQQMARLLLHGPGEHMDDEHVVAVRTLLYRAGVAWQPDHPAEDS